MFDRFARLTQARRALAAGRTEEALGLLNDPLISADRRAADLRHRALAALLLRARDRKARSDRAGAVADLEAILVWQPGHEGAREALSALRDEQATARRVEEEIRVELRQARELLDAGDLDAADAQVQRIQAERGEDPELVGLAKAIAGRRSTVAVLCEGVRKLLREGDAYGARDLLRQVVGLARSTAVVATLTAEVTRALGRSVARAVLEDLRSGAPVAACARLAREQGEWRDLADAAELERVRRLAAHAARRAMTRNLRAGQLREALVQFAAVDQRGGARALLGAFAEAMLELREGLAADEAGDVTRAAAALGKAAQELRSTEVRALRDRAQAAAAAIGSSLERCRKLAAAGDLTGARQCLDEALARWPLSRPLLEEMRVMDEGAKERASRLMAARQHANQGRLREALAAAVALASPGHVGEDARRLQADVQAKIDVVAAGIDQIKRSVHGRSSGSVEGLAHCVARLDELAKVQADDSELVRLRGALDAERRALELIRDLVGVLENGSVPSEVAGTTRSIVAARGSFLSPDRLDARLLVLADATASRAEIECTKGRLQSAELCSRALQVLSEALPSVAPRADEVASRLEAARSQAREAVERARAALAARELDSAESAFELAERIAADDDAVRDLGNRLDDLRRRVRELQVVEGMAAHGDFARAHQKLATLPPTPPALRTKIFDLKRNLARAQGLDGGFVLRVDEGGEFLVLRRESVSIGNLRDGRADIAVLANISGQHASIRRRMSFHGGMEDRILADRGPVTVNQRPAVEQRLRDGDEIGLGEQLRLAYRVPSSRSLTTLLRVLGGIQTRGIDRILLMKDRGRDGRIIIGRARDAHVHVPVDGAEVELYAGMDGQIRVRCEGSCTMDGRPFTGEHPVTAGAIVQCAGVSFVLLPVAP